MMSNREDAFARFILDEAFRTGYVGSLVEDHGLWMVDLGKSFETYVFEELCGYTGVFSVEDRDRVYDRLVDYFGVGGFERGIYVVNVVGDVHLIVVVGEDGDVTINRYVFGPETTEQDLDKLLDIVKGLIEAAY